MAQASTTRGDRLPPVGRRKAGVSTLPWWDDTVDFALRVVRGTDCINPLCSGHELHILGRNESLLLRAVWILLHDLGWRHYMPNGIAGLTELWITKDQRATIQTQVDHVWSGAVDYAMASIAGGTTNLGWSSGTNHYDETDFPNGLVEGDLAGAIGSRPLVEPQPPASWLRHMGWTTSTTFQVNAAWGAIATFGTLLSPWDGTEGHYTPDSHKLFTDDAAVRSTALDYANDRVDNRGVEWVSLSRPDGDTGWDVDFGDSTFGAKLPVTRQIELANHVAEGADYHGQGIVIQAYGDCAESPTVMPNPTKVCAIVVEAYRPAGKTIEAIIADYVDADNNARCPLGLYQYLYSAAWGQGSITAKAGSPELVLEAVNRVRSLPAVSPKVVSGESMTEFGLYGLGYYCYMRMVLDVGRVITDFTLADFGHHVTRFLQDLFPTRAVRTAVTAWYERLVDNEHKPLLSGDLLYHLWTELKRAMRAAAPGDTEQLRVVELCKFTRFLDLRDALEAAQAQDEPTEAAYDQMMEWLFRIRDSGVVDPYSLFNASLDETAHTALGLDTIFGALNNPPGDGRGTQGDRPAWDTTVPPLEEFNDPATSWITVGLSRSSPHGLDDIAYSDVLEGGWNSADPRGRQATPTLLPYKAKGKMRLWLIPTDVSFSCEYRVFAGDNGTYVEFFNQATGTVEAEFAVTSTATVVTPVVVGQLYEIRLTSYATSDQIVLDWWTPTTTLHYLSFDPGRDGDPSAFGAPLRRSMYFLVPDGISEIHFYADDTTGGPMSLYSLDAAGNELQDLTFHPQPRSYQVHPVGGSGPRVLRIAGVKINQIGFWLLNCPNLFALHPHELLRPEDA